MAIVDKAVDAFLYYQALKLSELYQTQGFCCCCLVAKSCLTGFVTPWTAAFQAPLSMRFPRQGYWSGLPFPPSEDLLGSGIEPVSPAMAGGFFTTKPPGKPTRLKNASSHIHIRCNLVVSRPP